MLKKLKGYLCRTTSMEPMVHTRFLF